MIIRSFVCRGGGLQYPRKYIRIRIYVYVCDYCYIGNAMTPIVCFWAKIIKGEPSGGGRVFRRAREQPAHTLAVENICSGFTGKGEKAREKK